MDVGSIAICLTIGALIVFASIGIGVCFGRIDNRNNQRQSDGDSDVRTYVPVRDRSWSRDNRCNSSNEELAAIIDGMIITGISLTSFEKVCLKEAAERLRGDVDDGK